MNKYQPGSTVTLSVSFSANTQPSSPVDPASIALRVTDPTGAETDYLFSNGGVTRNSAGSYSCQVQVILAGFWKYRWEATGGVFAAGESRFLVQSSLFPNPL